MGASSAITYAFDVLAANRGANAEGGRAFAPPYVLGGGLAILIGVAPDPRTPAARNALPGWRPVGLGGNAIAVILASHYDDPPREQPVKYDEVIVALLMVRGLRLAVLPLTMRLDDQLPVDEGRGHYSLPKVYDSTLKLSIAPDRLRITGRDLRVDAEPIANFGRPLWRLPCLVVALGARVFTAAVPVYGVAAEPHRRAIVALKPVGSGWPLDVRVADVPELRFRALWAQGFSRCVTWLGPPRDLGAGRCARRVTDAG
jgi:hypothetical protein